MTESFDEKLYSDAEEWLPYKVVRPNEMLHPYGMGPDLAALIMRSLRWLGDEEQGGRQMGAPDRERFLRVAQACEDYLSVNGGAEFGVEPHPYSVGGIGSDKRAVLEQVGSDALDRMKELFDREIFDRLWI